MPSTARLHQITRSLLYHVFNRGNARGEIYHDKEDYQRFMQILSLYSTQRNINIYHWALMPSHYHMLMELENPKELSGIMAGIARSYVHYHHKKYDSAGHLFQGRFKSQPVEKELYLITCGRYIERNPIRAAFVTSAEAYPFSSASFYIYGNRDGVTVESPLFNTFGSSVQQRQKKYQLFLKKFNIEEEKIFSNLENPQGSEEFKGRLIKERGIFLPRNGRPRIKKVYS